MITTVSLNPCIDRLAEVQGFNFGGLNRVVGGRYDAATTWWNVVHDMACQFLSPALKERLEWHRYGCGHMAYVDVPTLRQFGVDMEAFYAKA